MHVVDIHDLVVPTNRQRREFKPEKLVELANSISTVGLIHPVVIRKDTSGRIILVAGERRIKAMMYVWNFGNTVKCAEGIYAEGEIPCLYQGELDEIDAFEMELEENVRRDDLTWQEKSAATARLFDFRQRQALAKGLETPTIADIAAEVRPDAESPNTAYNMTREEILVAKNLGDPDVQKAKSANEAFKILKRKEELKRSAALGEQVGRTFNSSIHQLLQGDCLDILRGLPDSSVDVFLTDPPYGIDADQYGDSGGRTPGAHFYDDSFDTWKKLMINFSRESFRIAKGLAHAYVFGDIDNFVLLKSIMSEAGWKCFRTPLIWVNPTAMRTPWVDMGPQRKYQICLYAVKGSRPVTRIYSDVITVQSDENLNHHAQKPVALYEDLLRRSVNPGDTVCDPFCGSGTVFPASHSFKCKAIGIELDPAAYGIAVQRLADLGV